MTTRRQFLARAGALSLGAAAAAHGSASRASDTERGAEDGVGGFFDISLAEWSLHKKLMAKQLDNLDFPRYAKETFDILAVEYVNSFFKTKATDFDYLRELRTRAEDIGVRSLLIMIDGEGELAATDDAARRKAIESHFRWIAAAAFLGCHSIRVNAGGSSDWDEGMARAADSLHRLGDIAEPYGLNVIVENHGGLSSNGKWLSGVMRKADHPRVGTLPDFGNFDLGGGESYDRYEGVRELMPFAKAVSAKSYQFDEAGREVRIDYPRMLAIVRDAGYRGFVGIEYEGDEHTEDEGIALTKALLVRVREELSNG